MKAGDKVRVKPTSVWRSAVGDVIGIVESVTEHTRYAWVFFPTTGLHARRWRWEEFEPAPAEQTSSEQVTRP